MSRRRRSAVLVAAISLLVVCATPPPATAATAPAFQRAWATGNGSFSLPTAIATNATSGAVYVTDLFANRVERYDVDGTFLGAFGTAGSGNGQFNLPTAIAVAPDGSVFVVDSQNHRVQKFTATGTYISQWGTNGVGNGQFRLPSGIATDAAGNVYVSDTGNNRIQKFTGAGAFRTAWGRGGTTIGRFNAPAGIAIGGDGRVYVVDGGNDRVQVFTATGTFERAWGAAGTTDGRFQDANGIAIDAAGLAYVTDPATNRIQAFSAVGAFLSSWGSTGSGNGQFQGAWGVAIASDGTRILVTDKDNSRVQRFVPTSLAGARPVFVSTWGTSGSGPGQMSQPVSIAVGPTGTVYVVDFGNIRIQRFSATGTYLSHWGSFGSGNGQFAFPWSVAANATGTVFVSDSDSNLRVQQFTATGAYTSQVSLLSQLNQARGVSVSPDGVLYVVDPVTDRVARYNAAGTFLSSWGTTGSNAGQFTDPTSVAVDPAGNVYVADTGNNRIQKFTATGTFLTQWGGSGSGNSQFSGPQGVTVDPGGFVYVADTGNHRIQKFTLGGTYLTRWGSFGSGHGQFNGPRSVAVGAGGTIYVADTENHRIQTFASGSAATPSVALSADQLSVNTGERIDYHVTITNTTPDSLTGVTLAARAAPDCDGPASDVLPGATLVVDCSHNTGPDDAGPLANTVTLTTDQSNPVTSNTITTQVGPALTATLTAPSRTMATSSVAYVLTITNNTAGPLSGLRVADSAVPSCAGALPDLAAGASTTVNCTRPTTDTEAGAVVFNVASVDARGTQAAVAFAATTILGRVTGTLTGPGGPIAGAYVLVLDRDLLPLHGDATTNASGVFNVGVEPGRYHLAFLDPSGNRLAEYFNDRTNALALTTADLVTVAAGSGPSTASASLAASGFAPPADPATISGTVTDANGPVAGAWVVAVNGGVRSATRTNAIGQYTVGNVPAGTTYLEFVDPAGNHQIRWYHGDNGADPTPIPVGAGQTLTNVDEVLPAYP